MSEHLLIDPEKLYKLYDHTTIKEYYRFTYLPTYKSIDKDIFYDIINSLSTKQLRNLDSFIYKQIALTRTMLEANAKIPLKRYKTLISRNYSHKTITTKEDLNKKLKTYIKNDKIIGLFIMNQHLKFLYPC